MCLQVAQHRVKKKILKPNHAENVTEENGWLNADLCLFVSRLNSASQAAQQVLNWLFQCKHSKLHQPRMQPCNLEG